MEESKSVRNRRGGVREGRWKGGGEEGEGERERSREGGRE